MTIEQVAIEWNPDMPVFARESFLRAVSDEAGWLAGFSGSGERLCVLPFTIVHRAFLRLVRFRTEVIPLATRFTSEDEREFLSRCMAWFRSNGADCVIPASTNAIFRTFPEGADAVPYGSYVIDLRAEEDAIWRRMDKILRQNINSAIRDGVVIRDGSEDVDSAYDSVRDTFARSRLPFMGRTAFRRYVDGLGEHGLLLVAEQNGVPQSYVLFGFSGYSAYAIYAGNTGLDQRGAHKLLHWEAIKRFRRQGVLRYDFVGARIAPAPGSKQHALAAFKRRYGATLKEGFIWKFPLWPLKYRAYNLAARLRSGGDVVDQERRQMSSS